MSKTVEIRPVLKSSSKIFTFISARPFSITYKSGADSTTTMADLIHPALEKWCEDFSIKINSDSKLPSCVSSTHRPLLSRNWKIIVAKTSKTTNPVDPATFTPMEDTDQTLIVDRFMTMAYKRSITTDATMPIMWLAPISSDAENFCQMMKEKHDQVNAASKKEVQQSRRSLLNGGSGGTAAATKDTNSLSLSSSTSHQQQQKVVELPAAATAKKGGILYQHRLDTENLPESIARINEFFDTAYSEFIDRKLWLFRFESEDLVKGQKKQQQQSASGVGISHDQIHEDKRYVHWSDILKNSTKTSAFREGKSLKSFQGDKSALSEALGVAWEAAAEAEEHALLNWNKIQADKRKQLETQITADEKSIADAEKREEELRHNMEKITVKKAEVEVKEDRIRRLQDDVKILEMRLETARQVKDDIEKEKKLEKLKQADLRERLLNEETHSPLSRHVKDLEPGTALEAAMTVLSPDLKSQVHNALYSVDDVQMNTGSSNPLDTSSNSNNNNIQRRRHQQAALNHYLNYTPNKSNQSQSREKQMNTTTTDSDDNQNETLNPHVEGFQGYKFQHKNLLMSMSSDDHHQSSSMNHNNNNTSSRNIINNDPHTSGGSASSSFLMNHNNSHHSTATTNSRRKVDVKAALRQIHEQYGYSSEHNHQTYEQNQQQQQHQNPLNSLRNNETTNIITSSNQSAPRELRNWTDPGSVASAFATNRAYGYNSVDTNHQNQNRNNFNNNNDDDHQQEEFHQQQQNNNNNNDMRVPLRQLAADLDAYLTRSLTTSNTVLTTLNNSENGRHHNNTDPDQHQQQRNETFDRDHYLSSSASALLGRNNNNNNNNNVNRRYETNEPNYYGEDMETRKRILNRVHELKSAMN